MNKETPINVFEPVKKVMLKTFKKEGRTNKVKLKECEIQLGNDANLWRKIAIISASREIDYNNSIGKHELSVTPLSLMDAKRNLHGGG